MIKTHQKFEEYIPKDVRIITEPIVFAQIGFITSITIKLILELPNKVLQQPTNEIRTWNMHTHSWIRIFPSYDFLGLFSILKYSFCNVSHCL